MGSNPSARSSFDRLQAFDVAIFSNGGRGRSRLANASTVFFATTTAAIALPAHPTLDLATTGSTNDRFVSARRQYALGLVCSARVAAITLSALWLTDKAVIERFARMLISKPVPCYRGGGFRAYRTLAHHATLRARDACHARLLAMVMPSRRGDNFVTTGPSRLARILRPVRSLI
jgi:hypothetical protein